MPAMSRPHCLTRVMIDECWDVGKIQSLEVLLDLHPPRSDAAGR